MTVRKRSVTIGGHRTSYSIEDQFQDALARLATRDGLSLASLITRIDTERGRQTNLSSALRLYVLAAAIEGRLANTSPPESRSSPIENRRPAPTE